MLYCVNMSLVFAKPATISPKIFSPLDVKRRGYDEDYEVATVLLLFSQVYSFQLLLLYSLGGEFGSVSLGSRLLCRWASHKKDLGQPF
jgi:hypothetical protein